MKILFFSDNFPPEVNATAYRVYERAIFWVKAGHSVIVITSVPNFPQGKIYQGYKNRWYQVEWLEGIKVVRVKTYVRPNRGRIRRSLDYLSYVLPAVAVGLFQQKPDVIAASTPHLFAAVAGYAVAGIRRVPLVTEVADLWPASIGAVGAISYHFILKWLEKVELSLYKRSKKVVVLTDSFKKNLVARRVPMDKVTTIMGGVDLSVYRPLVRDKALAQALGVADKQVVGYIGTIGMAHGLENVLYAAAILKTHSEIVFLLVGDGARCEDLKALATRLHLPNVKFVGMQPKKLIKQYWSLCDIALIHLKNSPVFSSVLPSKMFEAMAMGIPLLTVVPEGEATRLTLKANVGWSVYPDDPKALAMKIIDFINSPDQRKQCADNGLSVVSKYDRKGQATKMLVVFAEITKNLDIISSQERYVKTDDY